MKTWCQYLCCVLSRKGLRSRPLTGGSLEVCPLFSTDEPHLECCVQFGAPQYYERHGHWRESIKGHEDVEGSGASLS